MSSPFLVVKELSSPRFTNSTFNCTYMLARRSVSLLIPQTKCYVRKRKNVCPSGLGFAVYSFYVWYAFLLLLFSLINLLEIFLSIIESTAAYQQCYPSYTVD